MVVWFYWWMILRTCFCLLSVAFKRYIPFLKGKSFAEVLTVQTGSVASMALKAVHCRALSCIKETKKIPMIVKRMKTAKRARFFMPFGFGYR